MGAMDNLYMIAVHDHVVLKDLADTVADFDRHAKIVARASYAEAMRAIEPYGRIRIAFVEAGPDRVARFGMGAAVRERGGRLVLLGNDAEREWEGRVMPGLSWQLLMRPFTTQAVLRHLSSSAA